MSLDHLNRAPRFSVPILPKELRKSQFRSCLHRRMNEEFNSVVAPHAPLPLPHERNQDQFKVDPVRIDAIIDAIVRLNPIAVDITGIWLLRTEAAVDVDFSNARRPKCLDGGAEPLQQPSATGRETEAPSDLFQRCLMISWWQRTGVRVDRKSTRLNSSHANLVCRLLL